MTQKLKEKISGMAVRYSFHSGESNICNINSEQFDAFMFGATVMYEELAPLVEWVDVKEWLPFGEKIGILYLVKWIEKGVESTIKRHDVSSFDHIRGVFTLELMIKINVTHWKKIEL